MNISGDKTIEITEKVKKANLFSKSTKKHVIKAHTMEDLDHWGSLLPVKKKKWFLIINQIKT